MSFLLYDGSVNETVLSSLLNESSESVMSTNRSSLGVVEVSPGFTVDLLSSSVATEGSLSSLPSRVTVLTSLFPCTDCLSMVGASGVQSDESFANSHSPVLLVSVVHANFVLNVSMMSSYNSASLRSNSAISFLHHLSIVESQFHSLELNDEVGLSSLVDSLSCQVLLKSSSTGKGGVALHSSSAEVDVYSLFSPGLDLLRGMVVVS